MGYIVPLILVAGLIYGLYRLLRGWAVRCGNATVLFAWQLFVLTGLFLLFLTGLLSCWLFGRWWLELPFPLVGLYGLYAATWLVLTWGVWLWRTYGREESTPSREAGWGAYLALVLGAALCGFVGFVLGEIWMGAPAALEEGRLSPTIRYEVDPTEYGFGAHGFEYGVYRSPAWFGVVHRQVAGAILDTCSLGGGMPSDFRPDSVQFRLGKDGRSVFLTCISVWDGKTHPQTVEVPIN